jgi:hypothetical protein
MNKNLLVGIVVIVVLVVLGGVYFASNHSKVSSSSTTYALSLCQNGNCSTINALSLQCANQNATTVNCGIFFTETSK